MYLEPQPKSIEGFEITRALFVADHTFTSMPPRGHRREAPAQQRTLSLGHSAAGAPSGAGTASLTPRQRSCMFAGTEELDSVSSGFKCARKEQHPSENYLSAFYIP